MLPEEEPKLYPHHMYYPIYSIWKGEFDKTSMFFDKLLNKELDSIGVSFFGYEKHFSQALLETDMKISYSGSFKEDIKKKFKEYKEFLVNNLEKTSDRLSILELLYFIEFINPSKIPLEIEEFSTTENFLKFIDKLIQKRKKYWGHLNDIAWKEIFYDPNKLEHRLGRKASFNYDPIEIGKYLKSLGERLNDEEIKCYGMDIWACSLSKSDNKDDWIKAKDLFEGIIKINEKYYSPDYYQKVLKLLEK